jgi:hypothetical protein
VTVAVEIVAPETLSVIKKFFTVAVLPEPLPLPLPLPEVTCPVDFAFPKSPLNQPPISLKLNEEANDIEEKIRRKAKVTTTNDLNAFPLFIISRKNTYI